jgi:hypothetical protein
MLHLSTVNIRAVDPWFDTVYTSGNNEEYFKNYNVNIISIKETDPPQITIGVPTEHFDAFRSVLHSRGYSID